MRNLLGWLETRLAQITSDCLKLCLVVGLYVSRYFRTMLRQFNVCWAPGFALSYSRVLLSRVRPHAVAVSHPEGGYETGCKTGRGGGCETSILLDSLYHMAVSTLPVTTASTETLSGTISGVTFCNCGVCLSKGFNVWPLLATSGIVRHEYMALAKQASVLREAMLLSSEAFEVRIEKCCKLRSVFTISNRKTSN